MASNLIALQSKSAQPTPSAQRSPLLFRKSSLLCVLITKSQGWLISFFSPPLDLSYYPCLGREVCAAFGACYPIPLQGLQLHTEHTSDPLLSIVGYDRFHVARVGFMRKQTIIRVFPFSGDKVLLVAEVSKIHDLSHRGLLSSGIAGMCHLAQPLCILSFTTCIFVLEYTV